MTIKSLPLAQLRPAPYNPRKPLPPDSARYRRLKRSIDEFDLVAPIVWNRRTGHVVAGHRRLEVARDRAMSTVPCVVVDLPLAREKALNVALNNPAIGSEWDEPRLEELLVELHDAPQIDATLTGFDAQEIQDLLMRPAPPPPGDSEDDVPRAPDPWIEATLRIPPEAWEPVRRRLDRLAARHAVELHVRLPD